DPRLVGGGGWGGELGALPRLPHVRLHGFLPDHAARAVIGNFDIFLCTSRDEGLGLPLLETQFAGVPVIAPDQDVFREVLRRSGTYIDPDCPREAARIIGDVVRSPGWRARHARDALANVARWNALAAADRQAAIAFLAALSQRHGRLEHHSIPMVSGR